MPSSRGSSQPRDRTDASCTGRGFFATSTTLKTPKFHSDTFKPYILILTIEILANNNLVWKISVAPVTT